MAIRSLLDEPLRGLLFGTQKVTIWSRNPGMISRLSGGYDRKYTENGQA